MKALLLVLAFAFSFFGFACLALAMPRHWGEATGEPRELARHRSWLRPLGWLLLALAFFAAWLRDGPSFGAVLWVLLIGAAALAVALTLAWRPRWLWPRGPFGRMA